MNLATSSSQAAFLSFLDLISCGLGGALLLFLIAITATPQDQPAPEDQTVVVFTSPAQDPAGFGMRAEVGLEWREINPGDKGSNRDWIRVETERSLVASVPSSNDGGGEALLVLTLPKTTEIEVRPYLRDFPAANSASGSCFVQIKVLGQKVSILGPNPNPVPLIWPGQTGQIVRFRAERSKNMRNQ